MILVSVDYLQSGEFSIGSVLDTEVDCYTVEINHCEPLHDSGLAFSGTSSEFTSHFCPCQEHHQNLLPIFAPVTHDLIAVPASQANVRHAFSVCSDIQGGPKDGLF